MPKTYAELNRVAQILEKHFRNVQDIEFTIERGSLYLLQTRSGQRTGRAAIKIAVDMVKEGLLTEREAVQNLVKPAHIEKLLHSQLDRNDTLEYDLLTNGLPASPGAAVGRVVFSSDEAATSSDPVILVRIETSSEDIIGMSAAEGIVTSHGGKTSHAAVVARGWGKPCVCGCEGLRIDYQKKTMTNGEMEISAGDWISIDGTTGSVYKGKHSIRKPEYDQDFYQFMKWTESVSSIEVRANADSPEDAVRSRKFGAVGIGLCRTEHMFFGTERIRIMRQMIFSRNMEERKKTLEKLLQFQRADFIGIFEVMEERPVTIRLLDPPLHEFLPVDEDEQLILLEDLGVEKSDFYKVLATLEEQNPMMGHRGCRLGISYPEVTEMQARAIMEASVVLKKRGVTVAPEIMIPLVGSCAEFQHQKEIVDRVCKRVLYENGEKLDYHVGTMIEVPRAALLAKEIADHADFFSFGTNDLTQMTFGFSRDDTSKFMPVYLQQGILKDDPFQTIDQDGVGKLIEMAVAQGRISKPDLKIGVCGEHGGDPRSIGFFVSQGFDYVSCSAFRVPVAILAAAQASMQIGKG